MIFFQGVPFQENCFRRISCKGLWYLKKRHSIGLSARRNRANNSIFKSFELLQFLGWAALRRNALGTIFSKGRQLANTPYPTRNDVSQPTHKNKFRIKTDHPRRISSHSLPKSKSCRTVACTFGLRPTNRT